MEDRALYRVAFSPMRLLASGGNKYLQGNVWKVMSSPFVQAAVMECSAKPSVTYVPAAISEIPRNEHFREN